MKFALLASEQQESEKNDQITDPKAEWFAALPPHLGFEKTSESVNDAQRQRESRWGLRVAETEDAGAGRAIIGFFGIS